MNRERSNRTPDADELDLDNQDNGLDESELSDDEEVAEAMDHEEYEDDPNANWKEGEPLTCLLCRESIGVVQLDPYTNRAYHNPLCGPMTNDILVTINRPQLSGAKIRKYPHPRAVPLDAGSGNIAY